MIVDLKEHFLVKSFNNGCFQAARDLYDIYRNGTTDFHKAAKLYEDVLLRYAPYEAVKLIYFDGDFELLDTRHIENEYLHAVCMIARYHHDQEDMSKAFLWAKKALDLYDCFNKNLSKSAKKDLKEQSKSFKKMLEIRDETNSPENKYLSMQFKWEKEYFSMPVACNDNLSS